ncbi:MAG TPA: damage-inducible protein DinB [Gammaproteobacteria bacterium]|nr:damage-inducible protein DinB [Gammaproteobacteria bacterium]
MFFDIREYALVMAQYNQWMNMNIFRAAALLDDQQRKIDCGLFFRSIHETLGHLLLSDRMWLHRFTGQPEVRVDNVDDAHFEAQKTKRFALDCEILSWADSLSVSDSRKALHYLSTVTNATETVDLSRAILHFFNHQTHHRGQVTAALSQQSVDFGITDLIFMPPCAWTETRPIKETREW